MLSKNEQDYLLHVLKEQLQQIKKFEKTPDDYFQAFAQEVSADVFLTTLIDKIKKL